MKDVVLCVPIHNAALTLRQTLDSLLSQTYPISKIKLFDNASTDETAIIIREYAEKYSVIESFRNDVLVSAEDNFTNCIQAASGDYCAIVHSDDLYMPDFISEAVKAFEVDGHCVAVFCHAREINLEGHIIGARFVPPFLKHNPVTYLDFNELFSAVLSYANFLTCPSAVVRSSVYKDSVKMWNGSEFKTSADLDTWLRIARLGKVAFISRPLMNYRVATTSLSFRMAKVRVSKHDLFKVLDHYLSSEAGWLTKKNLEDYRFLQLKDEAFRIINSWKNKIPIKSEDYSSVSWSIVFTRIFRSQWHFRITLGILASRIFFIFRKR